MSWELSERARGYLEFVRQAIRLWAEQPVLHRRKFLEGRRIRGSDVEDVSWFEPSGQEMNDEAWFAPFVRCLGMRLSGGAIDEIDERGYPIEGDTLLIIMNAHHDPVMFTLPLAPPNGYWVRVYDTAVPGPESQAFREGTEYELAGRSLCVLRVPNPTGRRERRAPGRAEAIVSGERDDAERGDAAPGAPAERVASS